MDMRELMQYAPKDCQPTVISKESILKDAAKRLGKKVSELSEEEKSEEMEAYNRACMTDYDLLTS